MVDNLAVKMVESLVGHLVAYSAEMLAEWKVQQLVVLRVV